MGTVAALPCWEDSAMQICLDTCYSERGLVQPRLYLQLKVPGEAFRESTWGLFSRRERVSQNKGGAYAGRMKQPAGWHLFYHGANFGGCFFIVDRDGKHFDHFKPLSWSFCCIRFRPYWWVNIWCQFFKQDSAEQRTGDPLSLIKICIKVSKKC